MKTKTLLVAIFAAVTFNLNAQTDYSHYLDKAMTKLEENDCTSASKYYNVYKEMTGRSASSIEVLIAECKDAPAQKAEKYALNDKIKIGEYLYRVAFVEDEGAHGFAIYDYGAGPITEKMQKDRMLPTRSEMALIATNALKLNLDRSIYYWTIDKANDTCNYIYKLETKTTGAYIRTDSYAILLIYRF